MIWVTLIMSLRQIRRNGLRSLLTMLGIIIGVGSVIGLVTFGRSATAQVQADISSLGTNMLIVNPGRRVRGGAPVAATPFEEADVQAIRREIPSARLVAGTASTRGVAVYGSANALTTIQGADAELLEIRGYTVAAGRPFSRAEIQGGRAVCVVGETVRGLLFAEERDVVGRTVRVGRVACQIVGVTAAKGKSSMGADQDDFVMLPLRTFQRRVAGNHDVADIFVSVADGLSTELAADRIGTLMRERRRKPPGMEDFEVRDLKEFATAMSSATATLTMLVAAIAGVSLLVGGIGIMNIMLVSVTERTREIGLRLAIGASASEVMSQFLVEAVVLSTLGGVLGIGLGLSGATTAMVWLGMPVVFAPDVVALAFGFSAAVGVVFGFLPARKAARLDPIEALRHE